MYHRSNAPKAKAKYLAIFAATACLVIGAAGHGGASDVTSNSSIDRFDIARDSAWRAALGLESDSAFVKQVDATGAFLPQWGVIASATEVVDLNLRLQIEDASRSLATRLSTTHPSTYAGLWIDQARSAMLTIATTDVADMTSQARAILNIPGAVIGRQVVQFPLAMLNQEMIELVSPSEQNVLRSDGIVINAASIDQESNRILVTVSAGALGKLRDIGLLQGPEWVVTEGAPSKPADRAYPFPHVRGGTGLTYLRTSGGITYFGNCTATLGGVGSGPQYFVITAGHCNYGAGAGTTWNKGCHQGPCAWNVAANDYAVKLGNGQWYGDAFYNYTTCDCGVIGPVANTSTSGVSNGIYDTDSSDLTAITAVGSTGLLTQGTVVCYSGASSDLIAHRSTAGHYGYVCSQVKDGGNGMLTFDNTLVTNMIVVDTSGSTVLIGGDSGAPLFIGNTLWGVASGYGGNTSYFSQASQISIYLYVTPLTS